MERIYNIIQVELKDNFNFFCVCFYTFYNKYV